MRYKLIHLYIIEEYIAYSIKPYILCLQGLSTKGYNIATAVPQTRSFFHNTAKNLIFTLETASANA